MKIAIHCNLCYWPNLYLYERPCAVFNFLIWLGCIRRLVVFFVSLFISFIFPFGIFVYVLYASCRLLGIFFCNIFCAFIYPRKKKFLHATNKACMILEMLKKDSF